MNKFLLCGFPRSGNLNTFTEFNKIIKKKINDKNLNKEIIDLEDKFFDSKNINKLFFKKRFRIYNFNNSLVAISYGSKLKFRIPAKKYFKTFNLFSTHDSPEKFINHKIFSKITKKIYIARPVNDVISSTILYTTKKNIIKLNPQYKATAYSDLIKNSFYIEKLLNNWNYHVEEYLKCKKKLILLKIYEDNKLPIDFNLTVNIKKVRNSIFDTNHNTNSKKNHILQEQVLDFIKKSKYYKRTLNNINMLNLKKNW